MKIGNKIGPAGMKYLSESLKFNNSIQNLNFWSNYLLQISQRGLDKTFVE